MLLDAIYREDVGVSLSDELVSSRRGAFSGWPWVKQ